MATRYVSTTGNDTTGTGAIGAPYATFAKAITVSANGDTILARNGTYAQRINPNGFSATQGAKLTIKAENPLGAIITGVDGTLFCCLINDCDWIRIEDFDFNHTHTAPSKQGDHCIQIQGGSNHIYIGGCRFRTRLGLTPSLTDLDTNYNQGYRTAGVSLRANSTFPEIDNCTFVYTNKGVHSDGVVTDSHIHDCTFTTIQSGVHFNAGNSVHAHHLIEDCTFEYSHMEDGFQTNPAFDVPNGTVMDCVGFLLRNCTFKDCMENVYDTKGGETVFVENCTFHGQLGNNNGLHATLKTEGGSAAQVTCGANEITRHRVTRFCTIYDGNGGINIWNRDCCYNNTFWGNRRNFDGYNSGSQLTKHKGVAHSEGTAMTLWGVKNNIFGHCYVGASLRTTAGMNGDIDYNWYVSCDHVGGNEANTTTYDTLGDWQTFVQARGWTTEGEEHSMVSSTPVDEIFVNFDELPTGDPSGYDTGILDTSDAYHAGGWLTKVNGVVSNSTSVVVDNSNYFRGEWGRTDVDGDPIYFAGVGARTVVDVNYTTHTLTLDTAITLSDNVPVYYGTSATPNIGAGSTAEVVDPPDTGSGASAPVALGRAAANTAVAAQDIPVVGLEGVELSGWSALFIVTSAIADGTAAATALVSVGYATSTGDQNAICSRSENAKNPANSIRRATDVGCIIIPSTAGNTTAGLATIVPETTTNTSVSINWSVLPPAGYLVHVALFNSLGNSVGNVTLATTTNGTVAVGAGFDLLFVASNQRLIPNTAGNSAGFLSFGVATHAGSVVTQQCLVHKELEASPTTPIAQLFNGYVMANLSGAAGPIQSGAEITDYTGSGFNLTSRIAGMPSNTDLMYLAMTFDGLDCYSGIVTTPASNGTFPITGLGLAPGFVGLINSMLTAVNTGSGSATAGAFGFSLMTGATQYSLGFAVKDDSATSDTESYSDDVALLLHKDDGSDGLAATLTSFDNDGLTLNVTANTGVTQKSIIFAIQGTGVNITPAANVITLSTTDPTTVRGGISITGFVSTVTLSTTNPTVTFGVAVTPAANVIELITTNPSIVKGALSITIEEEAVVTLSTSNPTIDALDLSGRVLKLRRRRFTLTTPKRQGMSSIREILESPIEQGEDESIPYVLDTTNWGGLPEEPIVAIKWVKLSGNVDVSDAHLTNDASASGNYIVTPHVHSLIKGRSYRLEVQWYAGDRTEEAYCIIKARE